jgi:hypothetical protein
MSDPRLTTLFDLLVDEMTDKLTNGDEVIVKDEGHVRVRAGAASLNVIRQFLKDQGIDATKDGKVGSLAELLKNAPKFDDDGIPLQ